MSGCLKVGVVPSIENVDIGIMYLRIEHIISGTVFGAKVFCTETLYERTCLTTTAIDSQCWRSLGTKFTVKDKDRFAHSITTDRRFWFRQAGTQQ